MSLSLFHWYPGSGVVLDCIPDLCSLIYFLKLKIINARSSGDKKTHSSARNYE